MLRAVVAYITLKFRYLNVVPWLFSRADEPEICARICTQIDSRPLADHDPITRAWQATLRHDIEVRRDNGPVSEQLARKVKEFQNTPLGEDAEGTQQVCLAEVQLCTRSGSRWSCGVG